MAEIATAALIMASLGLVFAVILATANHFLHVEEDPRLGQLEEMLPGNNCGACGKPGCRAFAETLLSKENSPAKCTVSSPEAIEEIAGFLGVDAGEADKRVARLKCGGGQGLVGRLASYRGLSTCRAAVLVNGGGRACEWGCLGLGDCERACTFKAIRMDQGRYASRGLPVVDVDLCTACNDCVEACPLDLFELRPVSQPLLVQCSSPITGDAARAICAVACDGCGRCAADAPAGVIEMKGGLPVVHWDRPSSPGVESTFRCPTGAIRWVPGQQFADADAVATRRSPGA